MHYRKHHVAASMISSYYYWQLVSPHDVPRCVLYEAICTLPTRTLVYSAPACLANLTPCTSLALHPTPFLPTLTFTLKALPPSPPSFPFLPFRPSSPPVFQLLHLPTRHPTLLHLRRWDRSVLLTVGRFGRQQALPSRRPL